MSYQIKLTPRSLIWTGDRAGECRDFRMTGFKGSLRWWYESLIRALDTYACDPTENGCILELNNQEQQEVDQQGSWEDKCASMRDLVKQKICPACYLFGCTGWKSRFGLAGAREEKTATVPGLVELEKETTYQLPILERTGFPLEEAELLLLHLLFSFISEHGSICGRMTRKPSEETGNNNFKNRDTYRKKSHTNYGLCSLKLEPAIDQENVKFVIDNYLESFNSFNNKCEWADFRYFWYADTLLNREQINTMVNRVRTGRSYSTEDQMDIWMGGNQGISKKIFAFHTVDTSLDSPRVWGYVQANQNGRDWISSKWPFAADTLKAGREYLAEHGLPVSWREGDE